MNNQRRRELKEQVEKLEEIKSELNSLVEQLEEVKNDIESIKDEEEAAYDNLPESFQEGEKGTLMQDAMDLMDDAIDGVDTIIGELNEGEECFQDAIDRIHEAVSC